MKRKKFEELNKKMGSDKDASGMPCDGCMATSPKRINNLNNFSAIFFNQSRLSGMLNKYMVINDAEQILMVMRSYQIYATESLVRKALDTNSSGFIFHTTEP